MSAQLAQAAQAVIDRWDSPQWEWTKQGPTADLIADLRKALAAFEAAPQQAQAPGWQLVPVEPTIQMLMAGGMPRLSLEHPTIHHAVWAAMLKAAPQQGSKS